MTDLYNSKTGEITGLKHLDKIDWDNFQTMFTEGSDTYANSIRGSYPKSAAEIESQSRIVLSALPLLQQVAAVLTEYCEMKQAQHERSEG